MDIINYFKNTDREINCAEGDATNDELILVKCGIKNAKALVLRTSDADNLFVVLTTRTKSRS